MIKYYFSEVSDGDCSLGSSSPVGINERIVNRERLLRRFKLNAESLVTPIPSDNQNIVVVDRPVTDINNRPEAECLITQNPDIIIGVIVADCIPLFVASSDHTTLAAVHLSRENLRLEFVEAVIDRVRSLTQSPLNAYLGPCLQKRSHALGEEYAQSFIKEASGSEVFMSQAQDGKCYFDYSGYASERLTKLGVSIAFRSEVDTLTDQHFFSSRGRKFGQDHGSGLGFIAFDH